MSYLERVQAKAATNATGTPSKGAEAPSDPFAGSLTGSYSDVPADLRVGLRQLVTMRAPQLVRPGTWPVAVSDAGMLLRDGWVVSALALGWSPLDLFGAIGTRDGDPDGDGLAVWLAGRDVLAICATFASVRDGAGRSYYNRRERTGGRLLWELGR